MLEKEIPYPVDKIYPMDLVMARGMFAYLLGRAQAQNDKNGCDVALGGIAAIDTFVKEMKS